MNEQPSTVAPRLEDALIENFEAAAASLPGGEAGLADRRAALARFAEAGLPHRRMEDWKYTDLRRLMRSAAPLAGEADNADIEALEASDPLDGVERHRVVIANGRYRPDLSTAEGVSGLSVTDATGAQSSADGDAIADLNTAYLQGGVAIRVAAGAAVEGQVEVVHLAAAGTPVSIASRVSVEVGENAEVNLVETFRSQDGLEHQINTRADLTVDKAARVGWTRLQLEGDATQNLSSFSASLQRDATMNHLAINAGAGLWRWSGNAVVEGEGAHAGFSGATLLSGNQHGDTKLTLTHRSGYSTSKELFKNVVEGRSKGAFQGLIEVNRDAQKTDARMMVQTLLLSDEAEFAAKPELEIFADDVQCGHGSTTGQLDESHLFYLVARGIPRDIAAAILVEAFLDDPIDGLSDGALAGALRKVVAERLARRTR